MSTALMVNSACMVLFFPEKQIFKKLFHSCGKYEQCAHHHVKHSFTWTCVLMLVRVRVYVMCEGMRAGECVHLCV